MLQIHLLGAPRVVRAGAAVQAPRGNKVWGLLAYLLLRGAPAGRSQLAELLFAEADDPLAALRWNLTQLRRLVDHPKGFRGDPLEPDWPAGLEPRVDVLDLTADDPNVGSDLLAGMAFPDSPGFEIWLEAQRRQVRGTVESLLHETAISQLARGSAREASDVAARLVGLNPLEENFQTLLVRTLAMAGLPVAAQRAAEACRELFARELGVQPGAQLTAALRAGPTAARPVATGAVAVEAQLLAGEAAVGAGATAAGLEVLARAVAEARGLDDGPLLARCLVASGTALVHAARGSDEEGAYDLHAALAVPGASPDVVAQAHTELGYVEFLRGGYELAQKHLLAAESHGAPRPDTRAMIETVRGAALSDQGFYDAALYPLRAALDVSAPGPAGERRRAYALSMIGRVHLLRGDYDEAATALDESTARSQACGWTTFVPWPESLRADVDLAAGDLSAAADRLERSFALGCQIGDPCWEGMAARGLGVLAAARGDGPGAVAILLDGLVRARRLPDAYVWAQAHVLDALAGVGVTYERPEAGAWVADLARTADRAGMREFGARAAVHRYRLGDDGALAAARALAAPLRSPLLDEDLVSVADVVR
ncbi:BTAD domain-containing putative transcriptional regulator [Spongisporangium articulatum]|uniref:BTAD domain-containing putative transcriptional regulator n=1 Tax=Spongisporangium articulatum TaxID=3362603 RepID=A0ABW8ASC5_9ACTN